MVPGEVGIWGLVLVDLVGGPMAVVLRMIMGVDTTSVGISKEESEIQAPVGIFKVE